VAGKVAGRHSYQEGKLQFLLSPGHLHTCLVAVVIDHVAVSALKRISLLDNNSFPVIVIV
jgi:hypothetical protein